jgi:hypothetical protein
MTIYNGKGLWIPKPSQIKQHLPSPSLLVFVPSVWQLHVERAYVSMQAGGRGDVGPNKTTEKA